jgi:chemotaxis protein CheX
VNILATAAEGAHPAPDELKAQLGEPFTAAVVETLNVMAGLDVVPSGAYRKVQATTLGEVSAVLDLSGPEQLLVLGFPRATALAVGTRILGPRAAQADDDLKFDCLGELANVVAGQAKAMLASTPFHFAFTTPTILLGVGQPIRAAFNPECLVLPFCCEAGEFVAQVYLGGKAPGG